MLCPPPLPPLPSNLFDCGSFADVVVEGQSIYVYLATTIPVAGFQFTIYVDGMPLPEEVVADEVVGSAVASGMSIAPGVDGIVVGVDLEGKGTPSQAVVALG